MAKDAYGVEGKQLEAWQLDGVVVSLSNAEDLTIQSVSLNYPRGMIKIQPINRNKKLIIVGASEGTLQLGAIIGPSNSIKTFLERYADVCRVAENVLTLRPGGVQNCAGISSSLEFVCNNCLLNVINISVSQQGSMALVAAGLSMSFESLKIN